MNNIKKDLSIYIHIPFCKDKCFYCDFLSFKGKEEYFLSYQNALLKEIEYFAYQNADKYIIKTIFFGGGTPSILPIGYIGQITELIFEKFNIFYNAEITIEANPGVLSYELISHFKKSGINRISIGVQALQDEILKNIGRIHTISEFKENYSNIRKVGFENVNFDLMFSLPNQTKRDFEETLLEVVKLCPEHISCYSLILEEGTKFYNMYENGLLEVTDENLDRDFYYMAMDILQKNEYNMYEISNFCKISKECKHNICYWKRKEYIGFGLGASSLIDEKRIKNTTIFKDYINSKNEKEIEILEKKDMYSEFIFLGLRMTEGIRKSEFKANFGIGIFDIYKKELEKFIGNGLILEKGDFLYLSKRGIDVSNFIFSEFI